MGGVIFLCTDYVIINTRLHDERALKSDDGLGAGYQVLLETGERMNSIPEETARSIAGLPGVERVHTVSGLPCQILLRQGNSCGRTTLQKSTENIRRSATAYRRKQKTAALRSNAISSAMTTICSPSWKAFLLEGKIDPRQMKGRKYSGFDSDYGRTGKLRQHHKKAGDTILLKVPSGQAPLSPMPQLPGKPGI